jgi:hypothetical protein
MASLTELDVVIIGGGLAVLRLRSRSRPLGGSRRDADGRWLLYTSAGTFTARHVGVACAPTSPELYQLFDQSRREILEPDVLSTFYVSAAVAPKNWFTTHRRAFLKGPDHRDHLIAARREGAAPDRLGAILAGGYAGRRQRIALQLGAWPR